MLLNARKSFQEKWNQVYKLLAISKDKNQELSFGAREQFAIKKDGPFTFVRNVTIGSKRPTAWVCESYEQKQIYFPFDSSRFTFNKIKEEETIAFVNLEKNCLNYDKPSKEYSGTGQHKIIINGTPIDKFHSLFVPFAMKNLPQWLNNEVLETVIKLKAMLPYFSVTYNSQGAASSVNHLHFQLISLSELLSQEHHYKNEKVWSLLPTIKELPISTKYIWGALYIKIESLICGQSNELQKLIAIVGKFIQISIDLNIPFNLIFLDQQTTFFVFRDYATKQLPLGFLEYSGVMLAKTEEQFEQMNYQQAYKKLTKNSLSSQTLQKLKKELFKRIQ